ncbi:bifunctional homocysteine S-methyltransferase/methylenetetrahydrofolate reductase [Salsuginibacillus kocurii]|uniref:bifunctional homocysteine S-methyltransferase/methylenetetrahydrofolate reductase n=1 Tax=Salsuginibacillus kocurii TaxID=427078 RepID=UPI00036C9572|nr:bifunctional homocysteine S-methyltransferase/methylenetetrahydrofolate reductase [Salsuginibacillus kocurii]
MKLNEALKKQVLVGDGAMGTLLHERGYNGCFEALNETEPEAIKQIHQDYIDAGSDVIQSNTYAANRLKLAKYELQHEVWNLNVLGVELAKAQAGSRKYVLATLGGIRGVSSSAESLEEIKEAIDEQSDALLQAEPDGLLLETYYDLEEAVQTVQQLRQKTDIPLIAQLSLGDIGVLKGGKTLENGLKALKEAGADIVGVNCRMGPYHMLRSFETLPLMENVPYSAFPNASLPDYEDGRFIYQSNPDYFYERAQDLYEQGVNLIGGCCGTRPEHIKAIAEAVRHKVPVTSKQVVPVEVESLLPTNTLERPSLPERVKEARTVIVELDPPKKPTSVQKFIEGAAALHEAGADAVTMADNSLATPRIDNLAMGSMIQAQTDARPLLHIACRDRNTIGLQSHLLGLHALGMHDILAVTGDPTKVGDFPGATSVYDYASFDLIAMIKEMNEGRSFSGKSLGEKTNFTVAGAFNPNVRSVERAVARLDKKIDAGVDYFMSQPIYSEEKLKEVYEATKHLPVPIFIGIMPLVTPRNAEFLHNEVPGIKLTDEIRERMAACGEDRQKGEEEGLKLAKQLVDAALEYFNGIYLITPFLRYEMTAELTRYIKSKQETPKASGKEQLSP